MAVRVPRIVVLAVVALLATAGLTLAAGQTLVPTATPTSSAPLVQKRATLVVPDLRNQAFVFAKGALQDAGFAWRVVGSVHGYSANTVATQSPAAGSRVYDTGAPFVTLTLTRNKRYPQKGAPQDIAPYRGTAIAIAEPATGPLEGAPATTSPTVTPGATTPVTPAPATTTPGATTPTTSTPAATTPATTYPAATTPTTSAPAATKLPATHAVSPAAHVATPAPAAPAPAARVPVTPAPATHTPAAAPKPATSAATAAPASSQGRPPAFVVAGAPKEPLDEISLPQRAAALDHWLTAHPRPTNKNVKYWLYQNEWIVTGARFGWWHGADALRTLVRVDRRAQSQWGVGSKSRAVAAGALSEVEARSR